jgi:hypothetical protein
MLVRPLPSALRQVGQMPPAEGCIGQITGTRKGKSIQKEKFRMYYRLEDERDYVSIKHVETDSEVGYVGHGNFVDRRDGRISFGCRIFNNEGEKLATLTELMIDCPMRCAAIAAANYQIDNNFADLKEAPWNDHADRVECRLGTLLADTALAFARGFCEARGDGLTAETRDKFAGSLAELSSLWWVSLFGSFNADERREEPYFANPCPTGPRLTFSGAAQVYGMRELRTRHPDLCDAERHKVLGWVLQWLSDLLSNERKNQRHHGVQNNHMHPKLSDGSFFNISMQWLRRQAEYLECRENTVIH